VVLSSVPAVVALFVVCTAVILFTGFRLSRYGDAIADATGWGGTWIGLILLSTVTSLPELVTGVSAIVVVDVPDIAVGGVIGSCMFNLVILAVLDAPHPDPLSARIHQGHVLSAGLGTIQMGLAGLALVAGPAVPTMGWISLPSLTFLVIYVLAVRTVFRFERARAEKVTEALAATDDGRRSLRASVLGFSLAATGLVLAATALPFAAERLAAASGLEQSFVGSLFVATSTSLPEVAVSIAAVRIGAVDMAAANLFGSNLFNIAVLGLDDVLYTRGPLLADVSPDHLVALLAAIIMTAIAIVGLTLRVRRKRFRLSWDAIAVVAVYVIGLTILGRR
jgi:cation:H+ antiporter